MFFRKAKASVSSRPKTAQESKEFLREPQVSQYIVEGSFKQVVQCPEFVNEEEWIVSHVFDFYSHTMLFYDVVSDICSNKECPEMTAGEEEFIWTDNQKKAVKASAPEHIQLANSWIQKQFEDDSLFPTKYGLEFSKEAIPTAKLIMRYLIRIIAHIYYHHYERILSNNTEAHLNSLIAHMVCFGNEFQMLTDSKETLPLKELVEEMAKRGILE